MSYLLLLTALLAPLATAPLPPQKQESASTLTEVLARAQAAQGRKVLERHPGLVRLSGERSFLGVQVEHTLTLDSEGRYRESLRGDLSQDVGFDGHTHWMVDWSGTPRVLELGDLCNADVEALLWSGGWLAHPEILELELQPPATDGPSGARIAFHHRGGALTGVIELDPSSFLPWNIHYWSSGTLVEWSGIEWGEQAGWHYVTQARIRSNEQADEIRVLRAELLPERSRALFEPRLDPPADTLYDAEVSPELEVRRVASGHLLVHPSIDGQDLGWFIFDSGAGINCISTQVTQALESEPFGEIGARGIGGSLSSQLWRAKELRLGPLTIRSPILMGLDLGFLEQHFGLPVAGIVGFELLARTVAEFDQLDSRILLHDPSGYALPEAGHWQEVHLYGRHPCVDAGFEDQRGIFKIDTGAAGDALTFHYQAVRDFRLLEGRETTLAQSGGVGGFVVTRRGSLASFELGGHEFRDLEVEFTTENKGAFNDPYVLGNIGGKLLEPFVLVFDYPHKRVGFVPRD